MGKTSGSSSVIKSDAILWDDASEPRGNVRHIAEHGITPDEVERVLPASIGSDVWSRTYNRPARIGNTASGRRLFVVYEIKQGRSLVAIRPVTASPVRD